MGVCAADLMEDWEVDFEDPIMWLDEDGELEERVSEVLYNYQREFLPDWWLRKVKDYILRDVIREAEETNCGVLIDVEGDAVYVDRFSPWPTQTIRWGGCQPPDIRRIT